MRVGTCVLITVTKYLALGERLWLRGISKTCVCKYNHQKRQLKEDYIYNPSENHVCLSVNAQARPEESTPSCDDLRRGMGRAGG